MEGRLDNCRTTLGATAKEWSPGHSVLGAPAKEWSPGHKNEAECDSGLDVSSDVGGTAGIDADETSVESTIADVDDWASCEADVD